MTQKCIALLGKRDSPTDAIEEYCRYLGASIQSYGFQLETHRVEWETLGWSESLNLLRLQAKGWRDMWVLIQYTALGWSARGFPQRLLSVLKILKATGARVGIVFHDVLPYPGNRPIDFLRRFIQVQTMRKSSFLSDLAVFTVPPRRLPWLPTLRPSSVFVPVGANLPISPKTNAMSEVPTIGVFSITGGSAGVHETYAILKSVRYALQVIGKLRLSIFGRGAELHETELRKGLRGLSVELVLDGIIEPEKVVERFSSIDVLLFVRGHISSRRGSAIAAIAYGIPIVAYTGPETDVPITDAGVVLVTPEHTDQLGSALVRVLSDMPYRQDLANRSQIAYRDHFSWEAIASRLSAYLKMN